METAYTRFNMGKGASKSASAEEIPTGLDVSVLQQVPEQVKEKIIQEYNEYKRQYDDLQSSYENYRVNAGKFRPVM